MKFLFVILLFKYCCARRWEVELIPDPPREFIDPTPCAHVARCKLMQAGLEIYFKNSGDAYNQDALKYMKRYQRLLKCQLLSAQDTINNCISEQSRCQVEFNARAPTLDSYLTELVRVCTFDRLMYSLLLCEPLQTLSSWPTEVASRIPDWFKSCYTECDDHPNGLPQYIYTIVYFDQFHKSKGVRKSRFPSSWAAKLDYQTKQKYWSENNPFNKG